MDYFKVVMENILPVVFTIALPIIILLVKRLIVYLEKKWGFEMDDEMEGKLNEVIRRAVSYAEEKAMKAVRTGDDIPDGAKKLDHALEFAISEAERMGLTQLAREKLAELIEAHLFDARRDGDVPETLKGENKSMKDESVPMKDEKKIE